MFEPNWSAMEGMPDASNLQIDWQKWIQGNGKPKPTPQFRYRLAQYAHLNTVVALGSEQAKVVAETYIVYCLLRLQGGG